MSEEARDGGEWWESFFDDAYADLALARPEGEALRAEVAFLMEKLRLSPGGRVFDQCCGVGGLSLPLAARGLRVVGVDLNEGYVRRARAAAAARGLDCTYHVGDAFAFVPAEPCDAAFNWYTSFGYTPDDARNARMLRRAFEALRPGGRFALDLPNLSHVFRNFQGAMVLRSNTGSGEWLVLRETTMDLPRGMFEQRWTFVGPGGRRTVRHGTTKMYMPHAVREMLTQSGFGAVEFYGSARGEPLGPDSPRCICVATKPEEEAR
jgi:SAM-dependent methyltransferase